MRLASCSEILEVSPHMLGQYSPIHQTRTPHFRYRYPPSILYPHPPRSPRLSCRPPRLEGCQPVTPHKLRRCISQRRFIPSSIRTSLSAVSWLSLRVGIWARSKPPSVDQELKYVFSSFTKIPALSLRAPGPKRIVEIAADPPNENALPLDSFRNLQSLECLDIDPRTLLGWDRLSESLWSLMIKRSISMTYLIVHQHGDR
ncbi:hypothetical protein EDB83DRAFT_417399 [Lactarius deliciosus]|nr:hypothetical protein EDB83DRAFT_417399 [Lactarius deliciosus]